MAGKGAYSLDLREAALNLIKSGKTQNDVVLLLGISRSSLVRWLKRTLLAPSPRGGKKPRDLGVDLQEFLKDHPGKTLAQLSLLLPIKKNALSVRLRKARITFKKKITLTANLTQKKKSHS